MALSTVTLRWDLADLIQSGLSGVLSITPTAQMSDVSDHVLIPPVARTWAFTGGAGQLAGIVANDNAAVAPSGTGYLISVTASNGQVIVPQFQTQLNFANGPVQWLDALAAVPVVATSYQYLPLSGGTLQGELSPRVVTLADAATVLVSAALGNDYRLLTTSGVGASRTISAPSSPVDGQQITIDVQQPPSGGPCTVTWASGAGGYSFGTDGAPGLSAGASAVDTIGFRYHAGIGKWICLGWKLGFS